MRKKTTRTADGNAYNPLKDPHDGQICNEMRNGRPNRNFEVTTAPDGSARIARRNRLAAGACEIAVKRRFRRKENGAFALFYAVSGDLENTALEEINIIAELLKARFQADYAEYMVPAGPLAESPLGIRVSFAHQAIYLCTELRFERDWTPPAEFTEVK